MLRFMIYWRNALGLSGSEAHHLDQPHSDQEWRSFDRALSRPVAHLDIQLGRRIETSDPATPVHG